MRGTDHFMVFVDGDVQSQEIRVFLIRRNSIGIMESEGGLTLDLFGSEADDPKDRLKEALTAVLKHL